MTESNNILYFGTEEDRLYSRYLEINAELASGNLSPERRKSLENDARKIESTHKDFTLTGGGGLESDYTQPQKLGGRK